MVRGHDGAVGGFLALVDLTRASADDITADPGAHAAWDYVVRHAAPRPGETVTQSRFVIDREAYQGPSPTLNATPILTFQRYLGTPKLAWDLLTLAEPERWDAYFAAADMPRAAGADFVIGGRRYGLFAHDFRRVPVDALLELVTERALAQDVMTSAPAVTPPVLALSQPEFDDAVRQALRDLRRPDLLARNPLLRTRLVHDGTVAGEPSAPALEAVVRCGSRRAARSPPGRQVVAGRGAHLRDAGRHSGAGRRGTGAAVQHLPSPPHPGRGPGRELAVGPRALRRAALSTTEQSPVWQSSNRWAQPPLDCGGD